MLRVQQPFGFYYYVKKYVKSIEGLGDNIVGINIKGGQKDESAKEMYLLFNANTDNAKVTIPEGK